MSENGHQEVLVLGGGLAGIRAALTLSARGMAVKLMEKRAFLGGRAYSWQDHKTGSVIDNGQHLLMGAYTETLQMLEELGSLDQVQRQKALTVPYLSPKNQALLKSLDLPHPLGLAWAFLSFRALSLKDKWRIAQLMRWIEKKSDKFPPHAHDKITVKRMLEESEQTPRAIKVFWEPFTLATVNETLDKASSHRLIQVLKASLLKSKPASQLIFAELGLSEVFGKPAEKVLKERSVELIFNQCLIKIRQNNEHWEVSDQAGDSFETDCLLLAVPPTALKKILENSNWPDINFIKTLESYKASPIVSINLWYKNLPPLNQFSALIDSPLQWIFQKAKIIKKPTHEYLSLLVSADTRLAKMKKAELLDLAQRELEKFFPSLKNQKPYHAQVIKEQEATYSGVTGLLKESLPLKLAKGLYISGDWLHPDFPGTLESAVAMGQKTAELILKE